ncbi:hypothetical protein [Streptomyces sp. MMG1121]|uniref:hypothetical protein n=1 Tax=Streptomyces sp. MMG1121 TaxID=1415544 RepID=UPI0006AF9F01|nr:hypothetical protein [Streptomyces sp. MMG1121]KOV58184.1 hypothetical protein ADK64_37550 [Streptomyces sp. MMG1121]
MKKLMRRTATVSASAALAAGALLAAAGSAAAATAQDAGPTRAQAVLTADAKTTGLHGAHHDRCGHVYGHRLHGRGVQGYGSSHQDYRGLSGDGHVHTGTYRMASVRFDPWVEGQLLAFDPWIEDQLATFVHPGEPGHRHFVNDWRRSMHTHSDRSGQSTRR